MSVVDFSKKLSLVGVSNLKHNESSNHVTIRSSELFGISSPFDLPACLEVIPNSSSEDISSIIEAIQIFVHSFFSAHELSRRAGFLNFLYTQSNAYVVHILETTKYDRDSERPIDVKIRQKLSEFMGELENKTSNQKLDVGASNEGAGAAVENAVVAALTPRSSSALLDCCDLLAQRFIREVLGSVQSVVQQKKLQNFQNMLLKQPGFDPSMLAAIAPHSQTFGDDWRSILLFHDTDPLPCTIYAHVFGFQEFLEGIVTVFKFRLEHRLTSGNGLKHSETLEKLKTLCERVNSEIEKSVQSLNSEFSGGESGARTSRKSFFMGKTGGSISEMMSNPSDWLSETDAEKQSAAASIRKRDEALESIIANDENQKVPQNGGTVPTVTPQPVVDIHQPPPPPQPTVGGVTVQPLPSDAQPTLDDLMEDLIDDDLGDSATAAAATISAPKIEKVENEDFSAPILKSEEQPKTPKQEGKSRDRDREREKEKDKKRKSGKSPSSKSSKRKKKESKKDGSGSDLQQSDSDRSDKDKKRKSKKHKSKRDKERKEEDRSPTPPSRSRRASSRSPSPLPSSSNVQIKSEIIKLSTKPEKSEPVGDEHRRLFPSSKTSKVEKESRDYRERSRRDEGEGSDHDWQRERESTREHVAPKRRRSSLERLQVTSSPGRRVVKVIRPQQRRFSYTSVVPTLIERETARPEKFHITTWNRWTPQVAEHYPYLARSMNARNEQQQRDETLSYSFKPSSRQPPPPTRIEEDFVQQHYAPPPPPRSREFHREDRSPSPPPRPRPPPPPYARRRSPSRSPSPPPCYAPPPPQPSYAPLPQFSDSLPPRIVRSANGRESPYPPSQRSVGSPETYRGRTTPAMSDRDDRGYEYERERRTNGTSGWDQQHPDQYWQENDRSLSPPPSSRDREPQFSTYSGQAFFSSDRRDEFETPGIGFEGEWANQQGNGNGDVRAGESASSNRDDFMGSLTAENGHRQQQEGWRSPDSLPEQKRETERAESDYEGESSSRSRSVPVFSQPVIDDRGFFPANDYSMSYCFLPSSWGDPFPFLERLDKLPNLRAMVNREWDNATIVILIFDKYNPRSGPGSSSAIYIPPGKVICNGMRMVLRRGRSLFYVWLLNHLGLRQEINHAPRLSPQAFGNGLARMGDMIPAEQFETANKAIALSFPGIARHCTRHSATNSEYLPKIDCILHQIDHPEFRAKRFSFDEKTREFYPVRWLGERERAENVHPSWKGGCFCRVLESMSEQLLQDPSLPLPPPRITSYVHRKGACILDECFGYR